MPVTVPKRVRAARLEAPGEPEEIRDVVVDLRPPEPGEVVVRVHRAAVNFADERTCRTGANHFTGAVERFPMTPGGEVVGVRCDTGERVAALTRSGGYAQYVVACEELLFPVPDDLDDEDALAVFVPGLTAALLLRAAAPAPDDAVAVLGATGAVGRLLLMLLSELRTGAVIATARDHDAAGLARDCGATAVVDPDPHRLTEALQRAAGGPLAVVLDAVGGPVTQAAADALGRFGRLLCYGSASGVPAELAPRSLIVGSRAVVGFWLMDHLHDVAVARAEFEALTEKARAGSLRAPSARVFCLDDVGRAVTEAGRRGVLGRVVLDPWRD